VDYDRGRMRASDRERQETIDRLRAALDEGRLKMDEYLERMGTATEAVTFGELVPLYDDLPPATTSPALKDAAVPAVKRPARPAARRGFYARMPLPLKILWTIWGAAMSINIVVWVLVSVTTVHAIYPWPVWLLVPGAALFAVSVGVTQILKHHGPPPPQRPSS
jgi:hypothetical protein